MKYRKSEIALIQLKKAILLFEEEDFISAITLAGAASEIFEKMCWKKNGTFSVTMGVEHMKQVNVGEETTFKTLKQIQNKTKNELKHHEVIEDYIIEEDFYFEAEMLIFSAIHNYRDLFKSDPNDDRIMAFIKVHNV